jgi:membrane-bound metal-dependent hydrolase YbcI (DUF457 family)
LTCAFLGVSPDFDYALNFLNIAGGGWHHGFTHSIIFGASLGIAATVVSWNVTARTILMFSGATLSHTLLDFVFTESLGVALWWPFSNRRYKLRLGNPIDYTWSDDSFWQAVLDMLRISLAELLTFAPVLIVVILVRRRLQRA